MRRLTLWSHIKVIFIAIPFVSGCYLIQQGSYFLRDHWQAIPVDEISDESLQTLIHRSEEIRRFAQEHLGLVNGDSYTKLRITEKGYLVDVVSAVTDDAFHRYYWNYPLFGKLPYRGFYRRADAERLVERLQQQQLDVFMRTVDAFSAHGYFPDLLFSFMQDYPDTALARLIIHELSHQTLWIKGEAQFNEEFASFVGKEGSLAYLEWKYGKDSEPYQYELQLGVDAETFRRKIIGLKQQLQEVYARDISREEKLSIKKKSIVEFQATFRSDYEEDFLTPVYAGLSDFPLDNAYLDLFSTYEGNSHLFQELYQRFDYDLTRTIAALVAEREILKKSDAYQVMQGLLPP